MTLKGWAAKHNKLINLTPSIHVYVDVGKTEESFEVFNLEDFVVSTVSGPVRWLKPIQGKVKDDFLKGLHSAD